jgi:hypothetical protein
MSATKIKLVIFGGVAAILVVIYAMAIAATLLIPLFGDYAAIIGPAIVLIGAGFGVRYLYRRFA